MASAAAGSGTIIRGGAARGAAGKNWSVGPIGVAMDEAETMWQKAALFGDEGIAYPPLYPVDCEVRV